MGTTSESSGLPLARLRAIGFWVDDDSPNLPNPAEFVDPEWEPAERQAVADYLSAGLPTKPGCGCSPCRICGAMNGFEELTDGVFLWPEGLAHYVLDHSVRLPAEIVAHALDPANSNEIVGVVDTTWWSEATDLPA